MDSQGAAHDGGQVEGQELPAAKDGFEGLAEEVEAEHVEGQVGEVAQGVEEAGGEGPVPLAAVFNVGGVVDAGGGNGGENPLKDPDGGGDTDEGVGDDGFGVGVADAGCLGLGGGHAVGADHADFEGDLAVAAGVAVAAAAADVGDAVGVAGADGGGGVVVVAVGLGCGVAHGCPWGGVGMGRPARAGAVGGPGFCRGRAGGFRGFRCRWRR